MFFQQKYILIRRIMFLFCSIFLGTMVIVNLVRWYVLIKGCIKYGRIPCFEDTFSTVEPHLFTHHADIWILLIGDIMGILFFPFVLLIILLLKNKKGIMFILVLIALEIFIRTVGEFYEYLMYI